MPKLAHIESAQGQANNPEMVAGLLMGTCGPAVAHIVWCGKKENMTYGCSLVFMNTRDEREPNHKECEIPH